MIILGLNIFHGDSSACILKDGKIICAFEEERFTRQKHWAGFPLLSIKNALSHCKLDLDDLDYITISRDPNYNKFKKILFLLKNPLNFFNIINRRKNLNIISDVNVLFEDAFKLKKNHLNEKIKFVEHHMSHMGSSFFASPFEESAILSIDAFGDFTSTVLAYGSGNKITKISEVNFPHSIGQFYTAFTQYLGFHNYGDEYKVMGLAPYGTPKYLKLMEDVLVIEKNGLFHLNLNYFTHHIKGVNTTMLENNDPTPSLFYSKKMEDVFGPARIKKDDLLQYHFDIASSVQKHCENVIFHLANNLFKATSTKNLCITGGVGQNSVANGKIIKNTNFEKLYLPPAAHDAGTSIGSALFYYNQVKDNPRKAPMFNPYLGSESNNEEIEKLLNEKNISYDKLSDKEIIKETADCLLEGKVIGWFQGKAEFGPRALGGRSILVDPRRKDAKKLLNKKIKKRESFRPFAPSILENYVEDYFEITEKSPFMEKVFPIKKEMQKLIPAVTHVDGTGRLQTVNRINSPKYYNLINQFFKKSGVPMLLNTSFNENEPIVNKPIEALNCFLRTEMDVLVMENFMIKR